MRARDFILLALLGAAVCAAPARAQAPLPPPRPSDLETPTPAPASPGLDSAPAPAPDDYPPVTLPPASRARMHECGVEWQKKKQAGETGALLWRDFARACLTR